MNLSGPETPYRNGAGLRVAIASSGVGHVTRGMEAWAESLTAALAERAVDVTLFRGAGPKKHDYDVVIPCFKRWGVVAQTGRALNRVGGWRLGLGSPAQVESFSFGLGLLGHLRKGYDVVHVQQGSLARFLNRAQKLGLLRVPLVFANGQIAGPEFLRRFQYVQHLSNFEEADTQNRLRDSYRSFVIPNFVDTGIFSAGDKAAARKLLGLPHEAFVVLTVGAIKKYHKRMDYFLSEMARVGAGRSGAFHFVVAGARQPDTAGLEKYGRSLLGESLSVYTDVPTEQMPDLYRAADLFVLCSLSEAFGIVLIEAMSSSVPVICHSYPVTAWVVGEGGKCLDLQKEGVLAEAVMKFRADPTLGAQLGAAGRKRVLREFSKEVVISKVIDMYREVVASVGRPRGTNADN